MARRAFWLTLALWAGLYVASFAMLWLVAPTGDGFTRGLNRLAYFMLFQTIATGAAIALWVLGRRFPRGSALRWASRGPMALALLLLGSIVALYAYVNLAAPSPPPQPNLPATTAPSPR